MGVLSTGLVTYWAFDFGRWSKDYFINTYSPYLVIDTTLIAQIIHIYAFDNDKTWDGLMIFSIVLLSVSILLTLLKLYNGYQVYSNIEYKPKCPSNGYLISLQTSIIEHRISISIASHLVIASVVHL